MTCAPGCCFRYCRWSVSGGGLKEETHRQVRLWRWLETFSSLLAVSPRAGSEIVVLVVVEVIDMDDLDVIRLAVVDIIPRERIARGRTEVKEKFSKAWWKWLRRTA